MRRTSLPSRLDEALLALLLLCAFVAASAVSIRFASEQLPQDARSSLNAHAGGLKALYLLCRTLGYSTDHLEADWTALGDQDAALVTAEPYAESRRPTSGEVNALRHWIDQGGVVIYAINGPFQGVDAPNLSAFLSGELETTSVPDTVSQVALTEAGAPFAPHVHWITVQSHVRLRPRRDFVPLCQDRVGVIMAYKPVGQGGIYLIADDRLTSNVGIDEADNATLMIDILASACSASRRRLLFDDYHQGAGLAANGPTTVAEPGIWAMVPQPIRLAVLYLILTVVLALWCANRRFGAAIPLPQPVGRSRPAFLQAMARLLQRAQASDVACDAIYRQFRADLAPKYAIPLFGPLTVGSQRVLGLNTQEVADLGTLISRFERIRSGERIAEEEALHLSRQIESWRGRFDLVER
jgi:hypothetical protein